MCHPLCGNCTQYGPDYCSDFCTTDIILVNNSLLLSSGVCTCNYHYYFNENTILCEICDHFCGDCSGELPTECLTTCNTGYTNMNMSIGNPITCKCDDHYFFDIDISDCALCHPLCGDCYGYLNTECISNCNSNKNFVKGIIVGSSMTCQCEYHTFYDLLFKDCFVCHILCGECNDYTSQECIIECSMTLSHVDVLNGKICNCISHYYYNESLSKCIECHPLCLECSNDMNTNCLSCARIAYISLININTCTCQSHFFYNVNTEICEACHVLCDECIENTNTGCLNSCSTLIQFVDVILNSTCNCIQGYYYTILSSCASIYIYKQNAIQIVLPAMDQQTLTAFSVL